MAISCPSLTHNRPRRVLLGSGPPAPQAHNATLDQARALDKVDFDTNMVIILAALLCALASAILLNSLMRCAMRYGRRYPFETPEHTASRLATTGLKKSVLQRIPVAFYGEAEVDIPATECPICLGEFTEGEKVRVLPKCHHVFHLSCIDTWLLSHSSCPTCRQSLLDIASSSV